jgi:hypothetical protein
MNERSRASACRFLARARLTRWGYNETLSPEEFEALVERDSHDPNVVGDVDALAEHFGVRWLTEKGG